MESNMIILMRLLLAALAAWLIWFFIERHLASRQSQPQQRDWNVLLNICHGDRARASRLMEYEKKQNPGITEQEVCRRAIERYYRDNR